MWRCFFVLLIVCTRLHLPRLCLPIYTFCSRHTLDQMDLLVTSEGIESRRKCKCGGGGGGGLPPPAGLQHLVECVCDVARFKRFYLCTLCQITLRGSSIINHVISFDHVYRYIVSDPAVALESMYVCMYG